MNFVPHDCFVPGGYPCDVGGYDEIVFLTPGVGIETSRLHGCFFDNSDNRRELLALTGS